MRRVTRAYYERASYEEKNEAEEFYGELDVNRDGNIRFAQFRRRFGSWLEKDFRKLDSDRDRALDFFDVLVVFYYNKGTIRIRGCHGCHAKLLGPYFSCIPCSYNYPQIYDLCCRCYRRGRFHHDHPSTDFIHDNGLLVNFMRQAKTQEPKGEMEELRNIATLHYGAASPTVQRLARNFFNSMDTDRDGKVDVWEFLSFMSRKGYAHLGNRRFFEELNVAGNGALGFWEVMTLYYVMKSGRPVCDWCGEFIPGVFFSCVQCFRAARNSFNLCRDCYDHSDECAHTNTGGTDFLDNYTLLQTIRESSLVIHRDYDQQWADDQPSSSRAIVPASAKTKTDVAYKALELAIALSNTVSNVAVTASTMATNKCTIL
ncbi:hypothetical protein C2S51_003413 [Perilla frutescens var. frutescens]|nr:hypothetical protein C2S51_003413 [Perilla frutescens var. frutescens]